MKILMLMLQFTTRLPIPLQLKAEEADFQRGMKLLPLIGAIIGFILWIFYRAVCVFDPFTAAVGVVCMEAAVTGGLHLDGLGDTFDGLFSNRDREEMLAIMRDSRLGTHGLLAVVGVVLLKISLINAIANPAVLPAMSVFSRMTMVFGAAFSGSARDEGLGHMFIKGVGWKDALFSGILAGALVYCFIGVVFTAAVIMAMLVFALLFISLFDRKVGGMTGDTLGALGEISSVIFLAVYPFIHLWIKTP